MTAPPIKRSIALATAFSTLLLALSLGTASANLTKTEQACARKIGSGSGRLNAKAVKAISKCRNADISGKTIGVCPDAKSISTIDKAATKLSRTVEKSCGSTCSGSPTIPCLADSSCPPAGATAETCGGLVGSDTSFNIANLGFPGAFCNSIIGGALATKAELSTCIDTVSLDGADDFVDLVYGTIVNGSGISTSAASCLEAISKPAGKLSSTIVKGVGKCRDAINKGKALGDPTRCRFEDAKLVKKISKMDGKLLDAIDNKCLDADIVQLDLCGNGPAGTADRNAAKACLSDAISELSDTDALPGDRVYAAVSIIEAAFPPRARCGDNVINQGKTSTLPLGEECDGTDLGACVGSCAPAGDAFQCTCNSTPRAKLFVDYLGNIGTDTDAGWTGLSHNQKIAQDSGYITTLENCDCGGFTDATCTGGSSDPVCDAVGAQLPNCSWEPGSTTRCDARGNGNGADEDSDCWICDSFAVNAGAGCTSGLDCLSQCHDGAGTPSGPCTSQSDCTSGEVCRGRCDSEQVCDVTYDGGPLAVNTAGTAVCTVQVYKEPIIGTRNIVTGEHELNYQLLSRVHLAESNFRPCPVCGGFCVGGKNDLRVCQGSCSTSGDPCRFDSECAGGETCLETSPDCPGGSCELSLICGAIESDNPGLTGTPCNIDYTDPLYGTLSNDCPPSASKNITGTGFEIDFFPSTHAQMTVPSTTPCTAVGFELLDCPCPTDGGAPTIPNSCAPACDAGGPDFGIGCAVGNSAGLGSSCTGGVNIGLLCDEDGDCPGSACSTNPTHCKGDPAFDRFACSTNGDCGLGTCEDACPGGRCLPLCVADPLDPEDGLCADGPPTYHCEGALFQFVSCSEAAANATCTSICSSSGDPCDSVDDCPTGETCDGLCGRAQFCEAGNDGNMGSSDDQEGAGNCVPDERSCFLDPIPGEGGSTINGKGDPTNWFSVGSYCFGSTISPLINNGAGFGGPGRTRRKGTNVVNVTTIP